MLAIILIPAVSYFLTSISRTQIPSLSTVFLNYSCFVSAFWDILKNHVENDHYVLKFSR